MTKHKNIHGPRKRGAQFRNYNAFKHGLYSKRFKALTTEALADLNNDNVEEEIQVVRIMIARHLEMRVTNPPSSIEESLTDLPKVPKGGASSALPLPASPASCVCIKTCPQNSRMSRIGWMTS